MHIAVDQNQTEVVRILLNNGAEPNIKNNADKTPEQLKYNPARDAIIEVLSQQKVKEQMKLELRSEMGEMRKMIQDQSEMIAKLYSLVINQSNNSSSISTNSNSPRKPTDMDAESREPSEVRT